MDPLRRPRVLSGRRRRSRLRGEWDAAEDAYRRAAEHGCPAQPGLALLRLAEGDVDAASAGVRRALTEVTAKPDRLDLLKAAVTIYLEQGKIEVLCLIARGKANAAIAPPTSINSAS
jgi:hypothetical protein